MYESIQGNGSLGLQLQELWRVYKKQEDKGLRFWGGVYADLFLSVNTASFCGVPDP